MARQEKLDQARQLFLNKYPDPTSRAVGPWRDKGDPSWRREIQNSLIDNIWQYTPDNTPGLLEAGNISNLYNRIPLQRGGGQTSTASTRSMEIEGKEVLLPTVIDGIDITAGLEGRAADIAVMDQYLKTGKHFGKFDTPQAADNFANNAPYSLHERMARIQGKERWYPMPDTFKNLEWLRGPSRAGPD